MPLGPLPAYWLENRGVNSLWHAPIPPQPIGARLRYRPVARRRDGGEAGRGPLARGPIVRPNLPDRTEPARAGDDRPGRQPADDRPGRRSGLDLRRLLPDRRPPLRRPAGRGGPAAQPLATSGRSSAAWPSAPGSTGSASGSPGTPRQRYRPDSNLLETELSWRRGPIRVLATDFVAMGPTCRRTGGGVESPGQYLKRFRDPQRRRRRTGAAIFGLYVQAEVNGGIGEPGLSWQDADRSLLAANRGHGHANRKLARDSTVEFAIALDGRGPVDCEPTGPNEAILLRTARAAGRRRRSPSTCSSAAPSPAGGATPGPSSTGSARPWPGSARPTSTPSSGDGRRHWADFVEPLAERRVARGPATARCSAARPWPRPCTATPSIGAIAAGFDRGLNAYCWPRDAVWVGARDRPARPPRDRPRRLRLARQGPGPDRRPIAPGSRSTRSTAGPSGRRRRSTRRR